MARRFDGSSDTISFGSDASIDNWTQRSGLVWLRSDGLALSAVETLISKGSATAGFDFALQRAAAPEANQHIRFFHSFSTINGSWTTPNNSITTGALHHAAFTYDNGSTGNDPVVYIDGVSQALAQLLNPAGSASADAASDLLLGSRSGAQFFDGDLGWFAYYEGLLTAAEVNRHRWHGRTPGGPSTADVSHPLVTGSLVNRGGSTADGSATGTSVVAFPKVSRL